MRRFPALLSLSLASSLALAACGDDNGGSPDVVRRSDGGGDASPADVAHLDAARDAPGRDATLPDVAALDVPSFDVAVDVPTTPDVPATSDAPATPDVPAVTDAGDVVVAPDAARDGGASTCGTCAPGFVCGASGYCVTPSGVPAFGHVFVIVMENTSLSSLLGSAQAPYLNTLMHAWAYATHYVTRASGAIHPSCPNYIALTAGDTFGIDCDCAPASPSFAAQLSCLTASTSSSCPQATTAHLGNSFDTAGVAWREYAEDMGSPCNTADSGNYVARHVPFLYYNDVRTNAARCALRVRDFHDFAADLAAGTYRYSLISPNLCDDMHGNGVSGFGDTCPGSSDTNAGDTWLSTHVPTLLASPGFAAGGTDALFIVWDEEDGSTGSTPIPLIIVSPLVRHPATTALAYDHASLLGTIADGLGAARVGTATARAAPAITDIWR